MPPINNSGKIQKRFSVRLIYWHKRNKRDFPWRRTRDSYANLIAEALLRKTTSKQVANIYPKFMSKYPTPYDLFRASVEELEEDLKPLGISKVKALQLKKTAEILVTKYGGKVPHSRIELFEFPGIGLYSANAVLCFAYGEKVPLVDTNVARVLQRVFGLKSRKKQPSSDSLLWHLASKIMPQEKAREFNWALLDFAAKICTARNPVCGKCFLTHLCMSAKDLSRTNPVGIRG